VDVLFVFGFDNLFGSRLDTGADCSLPITTVKRYEITILEINSFHGRPRAASLEASKNKTSRDRGGDVMWFGRTKTGNGRSLIR
jgi:hypothetical protein